MKWALVLIVELQGGFEEHLIYEKFDSLKECIEVARTIKHSDILACTEVDWRYA